ncbi:MAG TPA: glycosyltransferase family A protein [Bacteroidales bacterium]|mgnify:CR=1 FL=1|nr:glycosyltransferase family A protein [Bacteroidales bacterium]
MNNILKTSDGKEPLVHISKLPVVDIAVTTFNTERFVKDCVESIIKQTYPLWHIYFVDDCSSDKTLETIKSIVKSNNIKDQCSFFQTEKNSGYGTTLKWAIEMGENELVAIVDSDDFLDNDDALKLVVEEHKKYPEVSLIYTDYNQIVSTHYTRKELIRAMPPTNGKFLGKFKDGVYMGTDADISHLKVFKRGFYNMTIGLDHRLIKAVDKDLILKLEEVGRMHYIRKALYCYRKHSTSITSVYRDRSIEYHKRVMDLKNAMYLNAKHRRERGILLRVGDTYTYSENGKKMGLNCRGGSDVYC